MQPRDIDADGARVVSNEKGGGNVDDMDRANKVLSRGGYSTSRRQYLARPSVLSFDNVKNKIQDK